MWTTDIFKLNLFKTITLFIHSLYGHLTSISFDEFVYMNWYWLENFRSIRVFICRLITKYNIVKMLQMKPSMAISTTHFLLFLRQLQIRGLYFFLFE